MRYLDHPNIVKLHEVYEGRNHVYLVMDLIEGDQLDECLVSNIRFSE